MANQIKRSEIILANGTAAVISTSEIYPGEYETMLATPDFETEYRVLKSYDKESALSDHKWLKEQYHIPPLTGKYLQLSKDLEEAAREGAARVTGMIDSGTCNFDSPTLYLKGWNQKKVEQAARAAGLGCFIWNLWGTKYFVFSVNVSAQGDPRTTAAEAMSNYLKQKRLLRWYVLPDGLREAGTMVYCLLFCMIPTIAAILDALYGGPSWY